MFIRIKYNMNAIVDSDDFNKINAHKWTYRIGKTNRYGYAVRMLWKYNKSHCIYMHREIIGAKSGEIVDHINHNGLDNRKENLRIVSASISSINRRIFSKRSGLPQGVRKSGNKFQARICHNEKRASLGVFTTAAEAGRAYQDRAKRLLTLTEWTP